MSAPPCLYIHIPFCLAKCHYCNFNSAPHPPHIHSEYIDALACELERRTMHRRQAFRTIYIGGGTPSILDKASRAKLMDLLTVLIAENPIEEVSIEANPTSISPEVLADWKAAGVNRVSLGVQSFDDNTLRAMNRCYDSGRIHWAIDKIQQSQIEQFGLDLIAGYPHDTMESWERSIAALLRISPAHVSIYQLEYSERLISQLTLQSQSPTPESIVNDRLEMADKMLTGHGYEHYETSNYAKPGKTCRHNLLIWRGYDFLGIGAGAHSRQGYQRWHNRSAPQAYLQSLQANQLPTENKETLSRLTDACERLIFNFRMMRPFDMTEFINEHASNLPDSVYKQWNQTLAQLVDQQAISQTGPNSWRVTRQGARCADMIAESLLITDCED